MQCPFVMDYINENSKISMDNSWSENRWPPCPFQHLSKIEPILLSILLNTVIEVSFESNSLCSPQKACKSFANIIINIHR